MKSAKLCTRVMGLFDKLATLSPAAITLETQRLTTSSALSASSSESALASDVQTPRKNMATAPTALQVEASMELEVKRELWTQTAKLLAKSGAWQRVLAVVYGLPPELQERVAGAAVEERWLVPAEGRVVLQMVRSRVSSAARAREEPLMSLSRSAGGAAAGAVALTAAGPPHEVVSPPLMSSLQQPRKSPPERQGTSDDLAHATLDDIIAHAFALRQPLTGEAAIALSQQHESVATELRRRGAIHAALQCIVNWMSRGLLVDRFYASGNESSSSTSADICRTTAPVSSLTLQDSKSSSTFDAIAFVRDWLFPVLMEQPPPCAGRRHQVAHRASSQSSPATTAVTTTTKDELPWRIAMEKFPLVFARCIRDAAACDRFVAANTPNDVRTALATLLSCVEEVRHLDPRSAENLEVLWRACSRLSRAMRHDLRTGTKRAVEGILLQLAAALEATAHATQALPSHQGACISIHDRHAPNASSGSPASGNEQRQSGLSAKTIHAMRCTVESVCVCLPFNPPQVRFLGLAWFARIGLALDALATSDGKRPGLTNGLVQCLFLCLGDRFTTPTTAAEFLRAMRTSTIKGATGSVKPSAPLLSFLSAAPMERHSAALDLLRAARAGHWFRVSATHLQSLLSGLQSVSIVRTWQQALMCVDALDREFGVQPGDTTMPVLLLNLSQNSWRRAFDVLRYYESDGTALNGFSDRSDGKHRTQTPRRRAPPAVMRDLHLLCVKHASWTATLRMMEDMLALRASPYAPKGAERRSQPAAPSTAYVGFMNYLYSIYAAATGGQVAHCLSLYAALADAPGRRSGTSPYNEVTTALAAVAFLDAGHAEEVVQFAEKLLSGEFLSQGEDPSRRVSHDGQRSEMHSGNGCARASDLQYPITECTLTSAGRDMARAAQVLGLVHQWHSAEVAVTARGVAVNPIADMIVALLNTFAEGHAPEALTSTLTIPTQERGKRILHNPAGTSSNDTEGSPADALQRTLRCLVLLQCMLGMGHLHAPIRLVFDTVAGAGSYEAAATGGGGTSLETRQVSYHKLRGGGTTSTAAHAREGSSRNRSAQRALYISPSHQTAQASWVARTLGRLARDPLDGSAGLSTDAIRAVAEVMAGAGVGPEFLEASLL